MQIPNIFGSKDSLSNLINIKGMSSGFSFDSFLSSAEKLSPNLQGNQNNRPSDVSGTKTTKQQKPGNAQLHAPKQTKHSANASDNNESISRQEANQSNKPAKDLPDAKEQPPVKLRKEPSADNVQKTDETAVAGKEQENTITALADALNMTEESIKQILSALGMTLFDLTDSKNLHTFMQAAFNVSSDIELLNIPNIVSSFESVKVIVADFNSAMKAIANAAEPSDSLVNALQAETFQEEDGITEGFESALLSDKPSNNDTKQAEQVVQSANQTSEQQSDLSAKSSDVLAPKSFTADEGINQKTEEQTAKLTEQAITTPTQKTVAVMTDNNQQSGFGSEKLANQEPGFNAVVGANQQGSAFTEAAAKANANVQRQVVDANDVISQIMEKMKVDVRGNTTEIKLTLRPENLGDVSLKVTTENGIITAQFLAENQRVKEVIESNFNLLKDALQKQGIEITNLSVSVGSERKEQMMNEFHKGQSQSALKINSIASSGVVEEEVALSEPLQDGFDSNVNYTA